MLRVQCRSEFVTSKKKIHNNLIFQKNNNVQSTYVRRSEFTTALCSYKSSLQPIVQYTGIRTIMFKVCRKIRILNSLKAEIITTLYLMFKKNEIACADDPHF